MYNLDGGKTGLDEQETKLPTYWNTTFAKICLGMKVGSETRFIVIEKEAKSLHSLIADGKFRSTKKSRDQWKSLIASPYLQQNCNREGFNTKADNGNHAKARIGIIMNGENNCRSCDSVIGFGLKNFRTPDNTCGNSFRSYQNNKAMGYIFVL